MTDNTFSFKQFEIRQEHCAMKIGTDSVLLGAWAELPEQGSILDIGAGTGILSLMAAQRCASATITAIEIDPPAACQARENIAASPWHERIMVLNEDFTQWAVSCPSTYDCIISNPPYFEQSLLSPNAARSMARHTDSLSYAQIFDLTRRVISPRGRLSLVLPTDLYARTNETAQLYGWGITRLTFVQTTPHKNPKRILCEWQQRHLAPCLPSVLTIHNSDGQYTDEYKNLTQDFYLHF